MKEKILKHLHFLKNDFRGEISAIYSFLYLTINKFFWTIYNKVDCGMRKISIGKKSTFYGKSYFFRRQCSSITIGSNCTFNSGSKLNLIGVNKRCTISTIEPDAKIVIKSNCSFSGTAISAFKKVELGENVRCGANTFITDSDWHLDDPRSGEPSEVIIGDNVWLGLNVVVLKGVHIGENSVIGAGSVVTKDIPSNVIAAGSPCKIIRYI